jgi:iron(III) transport system ATP-binding protein
MAPRPALILLDEPLSNLDLQVRLKLRQEIRDVLKSTGLSAIFVTHDQEEALSISDWVAVMRQGQIEQWGAPEQIYLEPASRFVAEFVTQANFLPARFNGETWETEVGNFSAHMEPDGAAIAQATEAPRSRTTSLQTASVSLLAPSEPSSNADLMIRQEDLRLEPDETATVVIRDRQFLGREQRYCLLTPSGRELHARTTSRSVLSVGTRVKLSVAETALRIFPRDGSGRLTETGES